MVLTTFAIDGAFLATVEEFVKEGDFYKHETERFKARGLDTADLKYVGFIPGMRDRNNQLPKQIASTVDGYAIVLSVGEE